MPRRTIALSSTRRIRIIARCNRGRSGAAGAYRSAQRPRRRGRGLRRVHRHPHREHAPLPRRRFDAQVPARQQRPLAHARDPEVAALRELLELVGHLEAGAVVGDGQHRAAAQPPQPHRHLARPRVAVDVAERLAQDPLELALGDRVQLADLLDRQRDLDPGAGAPAPRLGLQRRCERELLAGVGAQPDDDLARLAGGLACVLGQPPRLLGGARRVALDPARERERREAHARHGLGQRVVHVAGEPRALGLAGELRLRLGLAVEQAAQPRPRGGDQRIEGREHERGGAVVAHRDHPEVDADQHRREQRGARPAVDQPAQQRRAERVVEERRVHARQQQDQRGEDELGRQVAGVADQRRPDAIPVAQRDRGGDRGDDDGRRRHELVAVAVLPPQRDDRDQQDPGAEREDPLAGRLQPAARAPLAARADPLSHPRGPPSRGCRCRGSSRRG